jgi:hypothetical protein
VINETWNANGTTITPVAQFTFSAAGQSVQNGGDGQARFNNVAPGTYQVVETIPSGWTQIQVTPANATVTVQSGTSCAVVHFRNAQNSLYSSSSTVSSVSSSSSSSSSRLPECRDNRDNDDDGHTDYPSDRGCYGPDDDDEYNRSSSRSSRDSDTHSNNGDFILTMEASADEVLEDGTIIYTLEIENDTGEDLEGVEIVSDYPEDDVRITDDDDADEDDGEELRWFIGDLEDGDTYTVRYKVKLKSGVNGGDTIRAEAFAQADGYEDDADARVDVIGELPQTGGAAVLAQSATNLRPITAAASSMPLSAWLSLALSGLSGGGLIGRKFFL